MSEPIDCEVVPSDIKFKRTVIDPKLAQKWLDTRQLNNRAKRKNKVRIDGKEMLSGLWYDNGEVIKLAPDGELLDGMHRLEAIVENNIRIKLWVAYNVPKAAMPTLDTGSSRTFADVLRIAGEHNTVVQASVTGRYVMWHNGLRYQKKIHGKAVVSVREKKAVWDQHRDEFRFAAQVGFDIYQRAQILPPTVAGLLFMLTTELDYDDGLEFKDRLIDPGGLTANNPINALRKRLTRYDARELDSYDRLAMCIHAWNFWRKEEPAETIHRVYAASGGASSLPLTNANYPVPV